jgi:hypothetical protein
MKKVSGIWQESRVRLGLFGTSLFVLFLILNFRMSIATAASPQNEAQRAGSQAEQTSDDGAAALTIYNQNFFVAREYVPLDLKAGVNEAHYTGVAAHLEPDSVILRDPHGRALQILEQNYRNDPISQELLLSFYQGKTIDFSVGRNADGSDVKVKGKLFAADTCQQTTSMGIRSRHRPSRLSKWTACCALACRDSRFFLHSARIQFLSRH